MEPTLTQFLTEIALSLGFEEKRANEEVNVWLGALGYCNTINLLRTLIRIEDSWSRTKLDEMVKALIVDKLNSTKSVENKTRGNKRKREILEEELKTYRAKEKTWEEEVKTLKQELLTYKTNTPKPNQITDEPRDPLTNEQVEDLNMESPPLKKEIQSEDPNVESPPVGLVAEIMPWTETHRVFYEVLDETPRSLMELSRLAHQSHKNKRTVLEDLVSWKFADQTKVGNTAKYFKSIKKICSQKDKTN